MSEIRHTPDPWALKIERENGYQIFTITAPEGSGLGGNLILDGVTIEGEDEEEERTNARLMAAAPKLLAAVVFVKKFLAHLEDQSELGDPLRDSRKRFHAPLHEKLDAAIAQAEGR